jgi:hypothetical protein
MEMACGEGAQDLETGLPGWTTIRFSRASMRIFQFWILLLGSIAVSVLLIKLALLSRSLTQKQRDLVDTQNMVATAGTYENAWKQLSLHIYSASRQDPALAQVLKNEGVEIHSRLPATSGGLPPATTNAAPPSSKMPASLHPAAP